jgi:hypothetical protein
MSRFSLISDALAIVRLPPDASVPAWALEPPTFSSITRTGDELSVVCAEARVPPGAMAEPGWRAFKLQGPLPFTEVGVLVAFASPLACQGISIFAVSTFDTDYVLVKASQIDRAIEALVAAGHTLVPAV